VTLVTRVLTRMSLARMTRLTGVPRMHPQGRWRVRHSHAREHSRRRWRPVSMRGTHPVRGWAKPRWQQPCRVLTLLAELEPAAVSRRSAVRPRVRLVKDIAEAAAKVLAQRTGRRFSSQGTREGAVQQQILQAALDVPVPGRTNRRDARSNRRDGWWYAYGDAGVCTGGRVSNIRLGADTEETEEARLRSYYLQIEQEQHCRQKMNERAMQHRIAVTVPAASSLPTWLSVVVGAPALTSCLVTAADGAVATTAGVGIPAGAADLRGIFATLDGVDFDTGISCCDTSCENLQLLPVRHLPVVSMCLHTALLLLEGGLLASEVATFGPFPPRTTLMTPALNAAWFRFDVNAA
jgi:hypothetical protein